MEGIYRITQKGKMLVDYLIEKNIIYKLLGRKTLDIIEDVKLHFFLFRNYYLMLKIVNLLQVIWRLFSANVRRSCRLTSFPV